MENYTKSYHVFLCAQQSSRLRPKIRSLPLTPVSRASPVCFNSRLSNTPTLCYEFVIFIAPCFSVRSVSRFLQLTSFLPSLFHIPQSTPFDPPFLFPRTIFAVIERLSEIFENQGKKLNEYEAYRRTVFKHLG